MNDILFLTIFPRSKRNLALNHVSSLKRSGIDKFLCLCPDAETVKILRSHNIKSEIIVTGIEKDESNWTIDDHERFKFLKYYFINFFLKNVKYVWYMDVDSVITDDVRKYINLDPEIDIYFSDDVSILSTGCMLVKNSEVCKKFFEKIWSERNHMYMNEQITVNKLINEDTVKIKGESLSLLYFRPGVLYFDEKYIQDVENLNGDFSKIINNWLVFFQDKPKPIFINTNFIQEDKKEGLLKIYKLWNLNQNKPTKTIVKKRELII